MDVTRSNFSQTLPLIEHAVAECDFVSIDEEFSGLRKGRGGHLFDLQPERYRKMRDASIGYSIIQFGLTCFRRTDEQRDGQQVFQCQSFNIFIFPYKVQGLPRHLERNVEMQASAVSFLRSHGFDFNRLFDEGISYLTLKEETECEQALRENEQRTNQYASVVPDDLKDFVSDTVSQVDSFLAEDGEQSQRLDLPPCTAFKRKLVYQALSGEKYRTRLSIASLPVTATSRDCFLSITKSNAQAKRQKANAILTEASGFSRILQIISKCKKPLVGHNLFLDIMHVVAQFLTELPDTYDEFKETVHNMFPQLYDTKYIASTLALKKLISSTTLEDLRATLTLPPFSPVLIQDVYAADSVPGDGGSGSKYHQAGYDSFITGHCFILMNNYLQQTLGPKSGPTDEVIGSEIRRYVNRLTLTYSFDLDHYYMGGEDIRPQRKHVYHVSFPAEWNTQSLTQLFSPYGNVQVNWINDTSAFVGLKDAGKAHALNKSISTGSKSELAAGVVITPYDEFRSREEEEVTGSCGKRSLDQVAGEVRTGVIDEKVLESEESGKRVKRTAIRESGKKSLQTPFPEEKDW